MWWGCVLQSGITHSLLLGSLSIKLFINMGRADVDICYVLHLWMCFCISSLVSGIVISPRCAPALLSDFAHGASLSPCYVHAALANACASKAVSDPQEAQGDTHDRRGTDADVFLVLALNSPFVLLIDYLLLMFSVMRMVSEQEAVTLVPLASPSSISCFSSTQVSGQAWDSHRSRPWGKLPSAPDAVDLCRIQVCLTFIGILCSWQETAKN